VRAVLDALGADWEAEVVEMVPAADPASHTFVAKAELPTDERVRSGLFGRLVFPTGERQAMLVPETAVWRQSSLTGVFVVHEGRTHLRMVQLGASRDGRVEVNSGLKEGEMIAADASGLTDGGPVAGGGEGSP
jgi:multidrug efflux pump subunit AcrA (membrane-fusion protein)